MFKLVVDYFLEFKILKTASREFWLVNAVQFFDGLAYFSMVTVITLYLTSNGGFSDVDSGAWVGIWSLFITAFTFAVGSICDSIGIKKTFYIGYGLLAAARIGLGLVPMFMHGEMAQYAIRALIILLAFGTAFTGPVVTTSIRRFTTKATRSIGFNMYYLIMNVGAIFAGFAVVDGFRGSFGPINGNLAILDFGFLMSTCCLLCVYFIREDNYAEPEERVALDHTRRPLAVFAEVWKEKPFQLLILFLALTIGVRLVFTHQFLVMPKYYTRVLFTDYDLGWANSINPTIIVVGLILLIPVINKFDTFRLIVVGMAISALSLLIMAVPFDWIMSIPGIHNMDQGYKFIIYAQIIVFAIGELIFSPRFTEYISVVAPKDKVASYMGLSALPMFIAKPFNGFISGLLIASYSYEGIRAKIDSGLVDYYHSPELMWMVYFVLALISPIAVMAMRNVLRGGRDTTKAATEPAEVC